MFNGWKITNIFDVGPCELDTVDGPYSKTGYRLERREDGFAVTVGLMEHITGWSVWEILGWLNEKQAIPPRVTGCAAVCAIRVNPLVMRFFKEMT